MLKKHDPRDSKRCVQLRDDFEYKGHICMVFDMLGTSLFDFMKQNSFRPFPVEEVQHFAVQLVVAIEYMHSRRLTHTDLKPENIMIDNPRTLKVRPLTFVFALRSCAYSMNVADLHWNVAWLCAVLPPLNWWTNLGPLLA
jgi:serine/threonine protein kinase